MEMALSSEGSMRFLCELWRMQVPRGFKHDDLSYSSSFLYLICFTLTFVSFFGNSQSCRYISPVCSWLPMLQMLVYDHPSAAVLSAFFIYYYSPKHK